MPLLSQFRSFYISPFGEESVSDELNKFLKSNRIINVEKKLIDGERGTGWLFLVEYCGEIKTQSSAPKVDYKEVLSGAEFALFDKLRKLRKELADKQGYPVYTVFTNEQLAAIAKSAPDSLSGLSKIPGLGESKLKSYGADVIALLESHKNASPSEAEAADALWEKRRAAFYPSLSAYYAFPT
jgi:superfamily II DNA helicase RecQ